MERVEIILATREDAVLLCPLLGELGYSVECEELAERIGRLATEPTEAVFVARLRPTESAQFDESAASLQVSGPGPLLGCIHVGRRNSLVSKPRGEIHVLVVTEGMRGKGIGRKLLAEASKWAGTQGYSKLRLGTRVQRHEAHVFYERLGFEMVKEHRIYERKIFGEENANIQ